jgi:hypothetical protein
MALTYELPVNLWCDYNKESSSTALRSLRISRAKKISQPIYDSSYSIFKNKLLGKNDRWIPVSYKSWQILESISGCVKVKELFEVKQGIRTGMNSAFYQGQISSQEKRKIFRAEWMLDKGNHAQPHWHIHKSYSEGLLMKKAPQFTEEDTIMEFGAEALETTSYKNDDLKNFHFAMSSRWHKNEPHNNSLNELNELVQWLDGCINYINEQLNYIS